MSGITPMSNSSESLPTCLKVLFSVLGTSPYGWIKSCYHSERKEGLIVFPYHDTCSDYRSENLAEN